MDNNDYLTKTKGKEKSLPFLLFNKIFSGLSFSLSSGYSQYLPECFFRKTKISGISFIFKPNFKPKFNLKISKTGYQYSNPAPPCSKHSLDKGSKKVLWTFLSYLIRVKVVLGWNILFEVISCLGYYDQGNFALDNLLKICYY